MHAFLNSMGNLRSLAIVQPLASLERTKVIGERGCGGGRTIVMYHPSTIVPDERLDFPPIQREKSCFLEKPSKFVVQTELFGQEYVFELHLLVALRLVTKMLKKLCFNSSTYLHFGSSLVNNSFPHRVMISTNMPLLDCCCGAKTTEKEDSLFTKINLT